MTNTYEEFEKKKIQKKIDIANKQLKKSKQLFMQVASEQGMENISALNNSIIEFVLDNIKKKYNYSPDGCKDVLGVHYFIDKNYAQLYSFIIFRKEGQTNNDANELVKKILSEAQNIGTYILDKKSKNLDEAMVIYDELMSDPDICNFLSLEEKRVIFLDEEFIKKCLLTKKICIENLDVSTQLDVSNSIIYVEKYNKYLGFRIFLDEYKQTRSDMYASSNLNSLIDSLNVENANDIVLRIATPMFLRNSEKVISGAIINKLFDKQG